MIPLLVPLIPAVTKSTAFVFPGSINISEILLTIGFAFRTSSSIEYSARSFPLVATIVTFPMPVCSLTLILNSAILSPISLNEIVCSLLPIIPNNGLLRTLIFTFRTCFSIAKTVTGSFTVSPGPITRGKVPRIINGFRTGTVFSVFP